MVGLSLRACLSNNELTPPIPPAADVVVDTPPPIPEVGLKNANKSVFYKRLNEDWDWTPLSPCELWEFLELPPYNCLNSRF